MDFKYPKKEKLCSKLAIDQIFAEGKAIYEAPLKIIWAVVELPEDVPVQSLTTVSKRRFKRAVKRNLLKRRMREAFRLNKNSLYQIVAVKNIKLGLIIIYNSSVTLPYAQIEQAMKKCLERIAKQVSVSG
jgi:ribonuclease P protein component